MSGKNRRQKTESRRQKVGDREQKAEGRRQRVEGRGQNSKNVAKQKKRKWKVLFRSPKFLIPTDETIIPRAFSPIDYAGGILIFFICWLIYLHTLTPTVGLHDSGEMITAAYILGIPHPPGYPLYCLVGKLWLSLLPIGNIAYRMNLASALCASLTCMMVYFICLKVSRDTKQVARSTEKKTPGSMLYALCSILPPTVSALMLGFATTFWEQAVIAEKYTFNALFTTLLIFILLKWAETMSIEHGAHSTEGNTPGLGLNAQRLLYLFAFLLGLSFTHHIQTIYLVPASIFFIIAVWWKKLRQEKQSLKIKSLYPLLPFYSLLKMLCLFILPLFLYLYLPLRAIAHPDVNMGDPHTWQRFLEHIKAIQFGGYFELSICNLFYRLYTYLTQFFTYQFTIYLIWFGLIGAFSLFKSQVRSFIFLSLILIITILYSLFYNIPNIQDYYLPAFIIFTICIGYGIQVLINIIYKKSSLLYVMCSIFCLLLPLYPLIIHYNHNNRSQYYFATDLARNILSPMEEKSIIFLETDDTAFPIWYIHYVEKKNPKAILIDVPFLAVHYDWYTRDLNKKYPNLAFSFKFHDMLRIKTKELEKIRKERIYNIIFNNFNSHTIYKLYDAELTQNYSLIPQGIFCKILKKDISKEELCKQLDKNKGFLYRGILDERIFKDKRTQDIISRYTQTYYNIGSFYFKINMYDKAMEKFTQALKIDSKHLNAHYALGMCYKYKGMHSKAITKFNEILTLAPDFANAYYGLGYVYHEEKKILEAINMYKKALALEAELHFVRLNLGVAYLEKGMLQEAIFEFNKLIEINPQDVNAYLNLGIAYTKNKEYQKAITIYQKVLQLVPNHPQALANLHYLKYLQ